MKTKNSASTPQVATEDYFLLYLVAIISVIITIVVFFIYQKRKSSRRCVLLVGLKNSGKTLIFSQLIHEKYVQTHTSIKENAGEFFVNNKSLKIIDIPGHERLRGTFFDEYKQSTKGIAFVLDSITLHSDVVNVAKYLSDVLADPVVRSVQPKILILCNKQDDIMAKGKSLIKPLLETEFETIRSLENKNTDDKFTFDQMKYQIDFAESQASGEDTTLEELKQWLTKIA